MSGLLLVFVLFVVVLVNLLHQTLEEVQQQRVFIIQALEQNLEDAGIDAEVDPETGDVSILDSILFDEGRADLKPAGRDFLARFIPVYSSVIFSNASFEREIVRVVVEGHTSSGGSERSNMSLSLRRADSVLQHLFTGLDYPHAVGFQGKLLGAGRGELDADQAVDSPADRRVLFRLEFRGLDIEELLGVGRSRWNEGAP
ncbi:MAG: OmpA family protein [Alphaproteobacteria bacterium]|nr:OmpA family protein [Alphaproteobacteria bacterium]